MTLSKSDKAANENLALELIGEHCCNDFIGALFEKGQPMFQAILPTTWKALADRRYLYEPTFWHFQMTPLGWKEALRAIGRLCDEQTKRDLGTVCAALKRRIERTAKQAIAALVGVDEIVTETGLAGYWVSNVIDSRLIAECLKRKDAYWAPDDGMKGVIEVPIDFGHPL